MAGREFTVKARITADTKDAERNTRALGQANQELARKIDDLRAKFDAGEISAERFLRQQTRLAAQQDRLNRSLSSGVSAADAGAAGLSRLTAAAAGVAAGAVGIEALRRVLTAAVSASAEQEEAINRLRVALADLGPEADRVVASLEAQAAALQNTTTFADDQVLAAQARIAAYTSEEAAIELLTRAAADLAALRNIDLVKASDILIKAYEGEGTALKKLGIEVEGTAGSTERLRSIIEGVGEVAGGQAAAKLDTAAGAFQRLGNAGGEVLEALGNVATQSETVRGLLQTLAEALFLGADAFDGFTSSSDSAADAQDRQAQASERQAAALAENQRLLAQLSLDADKAAAAYDAMAEAQGREIEASDRFTEGLSRLGVRLREDVAGEIAANNQFLRESETLWRSNVITQQDYIRIAEAVAAANEKLAGATAAVTQEASAYVTTSDVQVRALQRQAEQAVLTARAFDALRASQGLSAAVGAAVDSGGQLVNSGTRVRVRGGSRLTSSAGFAGGSYSRRNSRFFPGLSTMG